MRKYTLLLIFAFCLGSISAQTFNGKFNNSFHKSSVLKTSSLDTLKILAVMVEFQGNTDPAIVGNGKFNSIYSQDWGHNILDPLPHDKNYFAAHLLFAQNYFNKVSNGKFNIQCDVLPNVITVSKTMMSYSPGIKSTDFSSLGDLSKEVWKIVDSLNPGFDFSKYQVFTIFHAGVGRDVTLPGSLGNERDLPSVYLSLSTLQKFYGNSFNGFPVSNGAFKITNSIILPQTENRELTSFNITYLFKITINGLIVSNIASYLGLPDLFDTKTGLTAIGRFGLMDGQSIFAYSGCFPPEPSAWEKAFLGWENIPNIIVQSDSSRNIFLKTRRDNSFSLSDSFAVKIPLNSTEYFIAENRQRDAKKNGAIVSIWYNGTTYQKTFYKDTTGFNSNSIDSLEGVITDVDEYDWALPGNGIVIWHIDDNIINANIANDQINADINNRGIYVEEANGVKEIGVQYTDLLGNTIVGEGSYQDFWYLSNDATLYKNRFSNDTRPNTNTNSGVNSLISFSNFSDTLNRMNFNLSYGYNYVKPLFVTKFNFSSAGSKLTVIKINNKSQYIVTSNSNLYRFDDKGNFIDSTVSFSDFKPAVFQDANANNFIVGVTKSSSKVNVLVIDNNGVKKPLMSKAVQFNITFSPVVLQNSNMVYYITDNGRILSNSITVDSISSFTVLPFSTNGPLVKTSTIPLLTFPNNFISASKVFFGNNFDSLSFLEKLIDVSTTKTSTGINQILVLSDSKIYLINTQNKSIKQLFQHNGLTSSIGLADLKQDQNNYIIFNNGSNLYAINLSGAVATNFPFADPLSIGFTGTPLTADFAGDSKSEIISYTQDGRIYAVDGGTGKIVDGFPISTGSSIICTPVLYEDSGKVSLASITSTNLYAWRISDRTGKFYWSQENGNTTNNSFIDAPTSTQPVTEFFPQAKAYNWPNPVYQGVTYIRCFVSEDSKINIKIFDLAGDFVAELNNNAQGGMDNETTWNVKNIQSGIYLARIEATGVSGKVAHAIIKIAIVK